MKLLDDLSYMILIGFMIFVAIGVIIVAVLVIYKLNHKTSGIYAEEIDYSSLKRVDSEDYLKFDDIKDDMIICDNGYRFVAAVRGYGFDFYHTSAEMQLAVEQGFVSFINTITSPTMFRQHSQAIDIEHTMNLYEKAYQKKEMELFEIAEDIRNINLSMSESVYNEEEKKIYEKRLEELNRSKRAKEWQKEHLRDQMAKLKQSSGENVDPERVQCWIFDWSYNPMDFTLELTKEQIYEKAIRELESKANAKIHALQNCKVRAVRCSTEDLIEMTRRYSSPITANSYRLRDVLKSSFFEDFNCETNHTEMVERAKESIRRSSSLDTLEVFAEKKRGMMPAGNLNQLGTNMEKEPLTKPILQEKNSANKTVDREENKKNISMVNTFDTLKSEIDEETKFTNPQLQNSGDDAVEVAHLSNESSEDGLIPDARTIENNFSMEGANDGTSKNITKVQDDVLYAKAEEKMIEESSKSSALSNREHHSEVNKTAHMTGLCNNNAQKKTRNEMTDNARDNIRKKPATQTGRENKRAMMEQWLIENNIEESLRSNML